MPATRWERAALVLALAALVAATALLVGQRLAPRSPLPGFERLPAKSGEEAAPGAAHAGGPGTAVDVDAAGGPGDEARGSASPPAQAPAADTGGADGDGAQSQGEPVLVVHVVGAVRQPGVYRLPAGARAVDAVKAAGGPTAAAALEGLNLAAPLVDGSQVYVPRKDAAGRPLPPPAVAAPAGPPAAGGTPRGPLDLNRASAEQLEALPGIGPALARRIVEHRSRSGPFRAVEDLLAVPGIGPKTLESLRPHVVVR